MISLYQFFFIKIDKEIFSKKKIHHCPNFIPPGSEMKLFKVAACELLNTLKQEKNLIYLMEDYNMVSLQNAWMGF